MGNRTSKIDMELPELSKKSYFARIRTTLEIYEEIVSSVIRPESVLLDLGCGKKSMLEKYRQKNKLSVGMDMLLDDIKMNNAFIHKVVGSADQLPFRDCIFDFVASQWMIEHIQYPVKVIREIHRVLKPWGKVLIATNSKYHPMMFLSSILPTNFRDRVKRKILPSFIEEDTFPTYYKFNSLSKIHNIFTNEGFERRTAVYCGAPFFMYNKFLYKVSEIYERVTSISTLRALKMHLIVYYIKKG